MTAEANRIDAGEDADADAGDEDKPSALLEVVVAFADADEGDATVEAEVDEVLAVLMFKMLL